MRIAPLVFLLCFTLGLKSYGQEITVFPGFFGQKYYEDSNRISASEVGKLMKRVPVSNDYWKKSKVQNAFGYAALAGQIGFTYYMLNNSYDRKKATTGLVGNLLCGGVAIGFAFASQNSKRKAILNYNNAIKRKEHLSIRLSSSPAGVGLGIQF